MRQMEERGVNQEYFSIRNLDELADVDHHLTFMEELLQKYDSGKNPDPDFPPDEKTAAEWKSIREQMKRIRRKRANKDLHLSVIGEFSTGKSTFINALLRADLLPSSKLQGTTAASTFLSYGGKWQIRLQELNGRQKKLDYPDFSRFREALSSFTTDSAAAKRLKQVHAYLPSEMLQGDLCIIDTPGTNVTEAWHEEATIRTLREESDLSVILISAERPVTETLIAFIRKHLEPVLPQCVFVVTYLDSIRPREREKLLAYIRNTLESKLEIDHAVVFPYFAPAVLARCTGENREAEENSADDLLIQQSYETEKALIRHTTKQRMIAISRKLVRLIDEMYQSASAGMETLAALYSEKLELIRRSQVADISVFVNEEREARLNQFDLSMKDLRRTVKNVLQVCADESCERILKKIDEQQNLETLKAYVQEPIREDIGKEALEILSRQQMFNREIRFEFDREVQTFRDSFQRMYQELRIISVDLSGFRYSYPAEIAVKSADVAATTDFVSRKLSAENKAFGGGAAAGAVIGTMIVPGVGTLLGGLFGGIFALFFTPDIQKVRKECAEKLKPVLKQYYQNVSEMLLSAMEESIQKSRNALYAEMIICTNRYRSEVEQMMTEHRKKEETVTNRNRSIKADQEQMNIHKKQLESVIAQIQELK